MPLNMVVPPSVLSLGYSLRSHLLLAGTFGVYTVVFILRMRYEKRRLISKGAEMDNFFPSDNCFLRVKKSSCRSWY